MIADVGQRNLADGDARAEVLSHIERYCAERLVMTDAAIVDLAVQKIQDGDVILTFATSHVVLEVLEQAAARGLRFRVVVVDSRPRFEGRATLQRLLRGGISCTYTHIGAVSFVMREATKVIMGAAAVLANGVVLSRAGTAAVAMVARAQGVPVLFACETCKRAPHFPPPSAPVSSPPLTMQQRARA